MTDDDVYAFLNWLVSREPFEESTDPDSIIDRAVNVPRDTGPQPRITRGKQLVTIEVMQPWAGSWSEEFKRSLNARECGQLATAAFNVVVKNRGWPRRR